MLKWQEGAVSLNFVFEDFSLPNGAYLNIVNSDDVIQYNPIAVGKLNDIIPMKTVIIGAIIFCCIPN